MSRRSVGWSKKLGRLVELVREDKTWNVWTSPARVLEVHYPHVGGRAPAPEGMMGRVIDALAERGGGVTFRPESETWDPATEKKG